jgi:dTDP-4-amino-4,6-dideoxygalactose transaminase
MDIPFYGIKRFYEKHQTEMLDAVHKVFAQGNHFGKETDYFENELCLFTGRKYAVSLSSCTDALYLALKSAGIVPGDEVLVTSFSFIASASPILRAGAIPVFVDISPASFLMDLTTLENKLTEKTKAIIAVHLFGQTMEMDIVENFAMEHNLVLIEDAAQALGSKYKGRNAGTLGLSSCLSFDPTKVISAFGSGGALLTDDENVADHVKQFRYHGKTKDNNFAFPGLNCRLSGASCALLSFQLKELLTDRINKLREIANKYNQNLIEIDNITLPIYNADYFHIYHKYVIITESQYDLQKFLKSKGIETMIHYPLPLSDYAEFTNVNVEKQDLINCRKTGKKVISLPIYPELVDEEIDYICESIKSFKF